MLIPPLEAEAGPPAGRTFSNVEMRVRFAETDLMAIAHHGSYLLWLEEARVDYLLRRRSAYETLVARGLHFPVVDQRTRYRKPARFAEQLTVQVWIGGWSRVTMRFDYIVRRGSETLATAYTTVACVDNSHRPKPIPESVLALCLLPEVTHLVDDTSRSDVTARLEKTPGGSA